jgi:hypothetical protein
LRPSRDGGSSQPGPAGRLQAALDPEAGWRTLWWLAVRGWFSWPLLRALAANPGAPKPLLWLLGERRWDVQAIVAGNPRCPRRVQGSLAWSAVWGVRAAVAANPATDPVVLAILAGGRAACVRLHVAANPSLAQALADRLLRDSDPYVRAVAAAHPAVSADGLHRLAEGMCEPAWVLRAIAANPACPADLSDQLLTWIALGGPGDADPTFDPVECTGHPGDTRSSPLAWYMERAKQDGAEGHPLWRVRAEVMRVLGRLPSERARTLARDPRPEVRRTIAGARQLPAIVRGELIGDADPLVARLASGAQPGHTAQQRLVGLRALPFLPFLIAVVAVMIFASQYTDATHQAVAGQSQTAGTAGPRRPDAGNAVISRRALPGGGIITCGLRAYRPHTSFIYLAAGSVGFTLHVANALMTEGGQGVTNPAIPAGGRARFLLYGSASISVTARHDGASPGGVPTTLLRCN